MIKDHENHERNQFDQGYHGFTQANLGTKKTSTNLPMILLVLFTSLHIVLKMTTQSGWADGTCL